MIKALHTLDVRAFRLLFENPNHPGSVKIARAVSMTGDGWLYVLILPCIIGWLKPAQFSHYIYLALAGFALERTTYYLLKNTFKRRRPPQILDDFKSSILASDEFSLPSGHTSAAFFVATFLCFGFSLFFLPLYLWSLAVGISRVLLGVHFPTDILMGAVLGTSLALIVL